MNDNIRTFAEKLHARWCNNLFSNATDNSAAVAARWESMSDETRNAWDDLSCFLLHRGFEAELSQNGALSESDGRSKTL